MREDDYNEDLEYQRADDYEEPSDGEPLQSPLPGDVREAVAVAGALSISAQSSALSNTAYGNLIGNDNLSQQNAASHQHGMNQLGVAVSGRANNLVTDLNPFQTDALATLETGNSVSEELAEIRDTLKTLSARRKTVLAETPARSARQSNGGDLERRQRDRTRRAKRA